MKAAVYGGAAAMVLGILGLMYLLLGRQGNSAPEVGSVTLQSLDTIVEPLQN